MALKEPLKGAKIAAAKRLENQYGSAGWLRDKMRTYGYEWMWYQDVEELATKLMEMGQQVLDLRKTIKAGVRDS